MTCRYTMLIQWSDEDRAFIVTLPEFGGFMTHGETYEDAARMGQEALESLIEAYQADSRPLPEPQLFTFPEEDEAPAVRLEGNVG